MVGLAIGIALGTAAAIGAGTAASSPTISSFAIQELASNFKLEIPEPPEGGEGTVDARQYSYTLLVDLRWICVWLRIPWSLHFKGDFGAPLLGADPAKCMRCDRAKADESDGVKGPAASGDGKGSGCFAALCGCGADKGATIKKKKTRRQKQDGPGEVPLPGLVQAAPRGHCVMSTAFVEVYFVLPDCGSASDLRRQTQAKTERHAQSQAITINPLFDCPFSAAELELELERLKALNSQRSGQVRALHGHAVSLQAQINSMTGELQGERENVSSLTFRVRELEGLVESSARMGNRAQHHHTQSVVALRRASQNADLMRQAAAVSQDIATADASEHTTSNIVQRRESLFRATGPIEPPTEPPFQPAAQEQVDWPAREFKL